MTNIDFDMTKLQYLGIIYYNVNKLAFGTFFVQYVVVEYLYV